MPSGLLVLYGSIGGFASGLLGIGGGIVLIPLLVYGAGVSLRSATSVSLVFIIFSSLSGLGAHLKARHTNLSLGLWMGLGAALGGFAGAHLAARVSELTLLILFGAVTGLAASSLLIPRPEDREEPPADDPGGPPPKDKQGVRPELSLAVGSLQGVLAGLLGLGGGIIVIPIMIYLLGLRTRTAVGTSLAVVLVAAVAGLLWRASLLRVEWALLVPVVVGAIPAAWLGGRVAAKAPPRLLRTLLSLTLWAVTARVVLTLVLRYWV
ncbi:MAG: TSUP family transporter [Moorellales bacterium]